MKTVIIGSGNVAEAIAKAVSRSKENSLSAICARNKERGEALARMANCPYIPYGTEMPAAELYIISVSDSAVAGVSAELDFPCGAVVAHTAGGITIDALNDKIDNRAVLYPLQTFSKGREVDFGRIPLFIESSNRETYDKLHEFASSLSGNVFKADSETRSRIHVAAVFASNFTNRMYGIGKEILDNSQLPFDILKPLIEETCMKALATDNPAIVQTGPAVRGDMITQEKHLESIKEDKIKTEIYKLISKDIWETSKKI